MNRMRQRLFVHVIFLFLVFDFISAKKNEHDVDSMTVQTTSGPVLGAHFTVPGINGEGILFRGIRYAAAATHNRRFTPPEDPDPWTPVYDASDFGPVCPQGPFLAFFQPLFKFNISASVYFPSDEDCLTLDIYTPSLESLKTVMVFIHGGAYILGNSRYEGKDLALSQNVVAVFIQYRLGALGWASTTDGVIPGNMGFMDQIKALNWIQKNILKFGGDPDEVTIYGQSAGGWSVSLHLVSPMSKGLFKRAIIMSGSKIGSNDISPIKDMSKQTWELAESIGCGNETTSTDLLSCLQNIEDPYQIIFANPGFDPFPTIDGYFIPDHPIDLMKQGHFSDVDVLAGVTTIEGFVSLFLFQDWVFKSQFDSTGFKNITKFFLPEREFSYLLDDPEHLDKLSDLVSKEYADKLNGDELRKAAAEMIGDMSITWQTYLTIKLLEELGSKNLYFYEWQYRPSAIVRPDYIHAGHIDDVSIMGATKTGFVNGVYYNNFTDEDKLMDEIMLSYWANFAKTGNPNGDDLPVWPSYRCKSSYMNLNINSSSQRGGFNPKRMKFWEKISTKF